MTKPKQTGHAPQRARRLRSLSRHVRGTVRTSDHAASKPGHLHISDMAQDPFQRARRAYEWQAATGRPIPPGVKLRTPLREPRPMDPARRLLATSAQRRRHRHKLGHLAAMERAGKKIIFKDTGVAA